MRSKIQSDAKVRRLIEFLGSILKIGDETKSSFKNSCCVLRKNEVLDLAYRYKLDTSD